MNSTYTTPPPPATITELAKKARITEWDERKGVKHYLRIADTSRRVARNYYKDGNYEQAFIEFARAATLVLEKLPELRDFGTELNKEQRDNLALNGQDILDNLTTLKKILVDKHDEWVKRYGSVQRASSSSAAAPSADRLIRESQQQRPPDQRTPTQLKRSSTLGTAPAGPRQREERPQQQQRAADYSFSRPPETVNSSRPAPFYNHNSVPFSNNNTGSVQDQRMNQHQAQQAEMERRQEEILKQKVEAKMAKEHERRRQQQQEFQDGNSGGSRAMPMPSLPNPNPNPNLNSTHSRPLPVSYPTPQSAQFSTPSTVSSLTSTVSSLTLSSIPSSASSSRPQSIFEVPSTMPLESPARYESDSEVETDRRNNGKQRAVEHGQYYQQQRQQQQQPRHQLPQQPQPQNLTPTRLPIRTSSYPPPITTTSPPPQGKVSYPDLVMSQHQKNQGYMPSLYSMFATSPQNVSMPSSGGLLFNGGRSLYPNEILPNKPRAQPQPPVQQQQHAVNSSHQQRYPALSVPPLPPARITTTTKSASSSPTSELKTVNLPRDCLHRFLSLASVNTSMNLETCGLLLGKDHHKDPRKFVVTTLLIPKQHSTSDTCTMDEEELVLLFTEERNLITLGWIHTHPSQSCFMSSVDLHTHSGFQRMLPESFAVVCAPKSNPNFGIFRLTDPPGLQTVLDCTDKNAFHPHPDLPIYTDADKGHVQMKEMPLEIVDLR